MIMFEINNKRNFWHSQSQPPVIETIGKAPKRIMNVQRSWTQRPRKAMKETKAQRRTKEWKFYHKAIILSQADATWKKGIASYHQIEGPYSITSKLVFLVESHPGEVILEDIKRLLTLETKLALKCSPQVILQIERRFILPFDLSSSIKPLYYLHSAYDVIRKIFYKNINSSVINRISTLIIYERI